MRKKRTATIKSKPTFAVVVDGDSEVWYLQMLKRNERSISVSIEPKIPQKKTLSEQFETVRALSVDYSTVFWIIDFDVILKETREAKKGSETCLQEFLKYRKKLMDKYNNVVIIINNPCIEFWLLLHFERTSKTFDSCSSAEKQLKNHLKDYEKTRIYYTKQNNDIYLKLRPYLFKAIESAKNLGEFDINNPSIGMTDMQLFFEAKEFGPQFK